MSIRMFSLIAAAALMGGAAPAPVPASGGLEGNWRNTKNTVHLSVKPCGSALCGTVTWAAEQQRADARKGSGRDLIGSVLLRDMRRTADGSWKGKIYVPDINSNASATIVQVEPNKIRVSGCTLLGLVCRSQHWHRMK